VLTSKFFAASERFENGKKEISASSLINEARSEQMLLGSSASEHFVEIEEQIPTRRRNHQR
jgi:hypothetical protein